MRIHVFNPEHDLALASNLDNFTAPHAGRELRHDLGFLPALWAGEGEGVLVEDRSAAEYAFGKLGLPLKGSFVTPNELPQLVIDPSFSLQPWGWDRAVRGEFLRLGAPAQSLPDDSYLNFVRQTSHRSWAAEHLLRPLRKVQGTVGEAETGRTLSEVRRFLSVRHHIVLKAPWSSSGRGVRYVSDGTDGAASTFGFTPQLQGWVGHVINRQGAILMEPYYNKVMDFGMEWHCDGKGNVRYCGLSLFKTLKGAYTGNLLADEEEKREKMGQYLNLSILDDVKQKIQELLLTSISNVYCGYLGVDMMIVNTGDSLCVHPCVEMNLRMTMGWVALYLHEISTKPWSDMRISFKNGRYGLELGMKQ